MLHRNKTASFLSAVLFATAACSSGSNAVPSGSGSSISGPSAAARSSAIQHIVIVMQEARSFDNLFCTYPGADGKCGETSIPLEANCTISNTFQDFQRDRKTGNFSHERTDCRGYRRPQYGYVPTTELQEYYSIAQQYVLGDRMFSATGNPTFEAHQYAIAAQAGNAENQPFGTAADGCVYRQVVREFGGGKIDACFDYETLADLLSAKSLTWSYYRTADSNHPIVDTWDAFGWIKGGSSGITPSSAFISDVCAGKLAAVTWVTPAYADSDLSGSRSAGGPRWVASVVNAVGESPFWSSSAIVIVWSGFGGWYDHVPPPMLDREGLGFRVPVMVVSPYALNGAVVHTQFETGSILRFVEENWHLGTLGGDDARANNLAASTLNLHQAPRAFNPIGGTPGCHGR